MARETAPAADGPPAVASGWVGRALAALAASLCLSLSAWALLWGWADLGARWASRTLVQWESEARISDSRVLARAHRRLRLALQLEPLAADHSADLARLHAWQALYFPVAGREARAHRLQALGYHSRAVSLRPSWALGWAELARSRALLGGIDEQTAASMRLAAALGPWEPGVQRALIWLGLATWPTLAPDLRATVLDLVRRSALIGNRVEETARLAARYGLAERVGPLLESRPGRRRAGSGG